MYRSERVFAAAVAVDIVCSAIFPARVFMVSPICGVGLNIELWLTVPATIAGILAEAGPTRFALAARRTRDTLMIIAVYKLTRVYLEDN